MGTGKFLKHEPCPRCGSRNNIAVFTDGKWCFGCGYHIPGYKGMSTKDLKEQLKYEENKKKNDYITLPSDYRTDIPLLALEWLKKYQLTNEEIRDFRIGWSEQHESNNTVVAWPALIFPAFDLWNNLLVFQRRTFGQTELPKYYTKGSPESVLWSVAPRNNPTSLIVCVEDFISAVRIGRQFSCTPLWGSFLSLMRIKELSDRYENLVVWLDWNKTIYAAQYRIKAEPYFKKVVVIATEKDPKEYHDNEIKQRINSTGMG